MRMGESEEELGCQAGRSEELYFCCALCTAIAKDERSVEARKIGQEVEETGKKKTNDRRRIKHNIYTPTHPLIHPSSIIHVRSLFPHTESVFSACPSVTRSVPGQVLVAGRQPTPPFGQVCPVCLPCRSADRHRRSLTQIRQPWLRTAFC
ncbi:hypothetical protein BC567DRAFT_225986 [Phyllosticta citribraziliensis]